MTRPKPQKRKQTTAVYDQPYWFDRARSLCELHGWTRSDPGDGSGLIGRYTAAVNRPVGSLDADQLVLLLTQKTDPHFLVPVALERVSTGDEALLRALVSIDPAFWRVHPHLHAELGRALAGVVRARSVGEDLAALVAWFVARAPGAR